MDTIHDEDWSDIEEDYDFKYYLEGRDKIGRSSKFTMSLLIRFLLKRRLISLHLVSKSTLLGHRITGFTKSNNTRKG